MLSSDIAELLPPDDLLLDTRQFTYEDGGGLRLKADP